MSIKVLIGLFLLALVLWRLYRLHSQKRVYIQALLIELTVFAVGVAFLRSL